MSKEVSASNISEAIGTLIAKVCYKAADEIGESFSQKTSQWRQKNTLNILEKASDIIPEIDSKQAHPRMVHYIIEEGSWCDDEQVQMMWAGLLASSCNERGDDDSNLIFINLLKQLSGMQVSILNFACERSDKYMSTAGWVGAELLEIDAEELSDMLVTEDLHRIDRELDQLRGLELIEAGFSPDSTMANITPMGLALQLYVRCKGSQESPIEFYNISKVVDGTDP